MSNVIKKKWNRMKGVFSGGIVSAACLAAPNVMAALPNAANVADGANVASPIQTTRDLFSRGITVGSSVVAAVLVLGATWQMYTAFVKAREKGDWKDLGVTMSVGVFMMAGGVILAVLANTYGQI